MKNPKFKEPKTVIPLPPGVVNLFASRMHRLHHALWHGLRDNWEWLESNEKAQITKLRWNPPRPNQRKYKNGWMPFTKNGSGIDFLFMHREMIIEFDQAMVSESADPNVGWDVIPEPGRFPEFEVPDSWTLPQPIEWLERRFAVVKSDDFYWSRMRWWDRQFHDHSYLCNLTLGQLGSLLETSVHNDMHMRWASQPMDPTTGKPTTLGRDADDIDPKWDRPDYDFLGETYSSHVNPIFWRLHKWVDKIVDEWYAAQTNIDQTRVTRKGIGVVNWFEKGPWVEVDMPWSSPYMHAHHDVQTMEEVYRILFPTTKLTSTVDSVEVPLTWF